ncbi:MAG: hypothetical protein ACJA2A_002027 [Cycloclasticus pugetii]|jgi:hypothetical protein
MINGTTEFETNDAVSGRVDLLVMEHVDEFIDHPDTDVYASWFLNMKRMPETLKCKFSNIITQYQLYCDYKGERYRVTGASRMGDVWLTKDFTQSSGYQERVGISEITNFSNAA